MLPNISDTLAVNIMLNAVSGIAAAAANACMFNREVTTSQPTISHPSMPPSPAANNVNGGGGELADAFTDSKESSCIFGRDGRVPSRHTCANSMYVRYVV